MCDTTCSLRPDTRPYLSPQHTSHPHKLRSRGPTSGSLSGLFQENSGTPSSGLWKATPFILPRSDCLPHSTGSLSSDFSLPKSNLPMALPFFLDFAQTSCSRRLRQIWCNLPSRLQSILRQPASLPQKQRQKHSTPGSRVGSAHPPPFIIQQCGEKGVVPSPRPPAHTILFLSIPSWRSGGQHRYRREVCLAPV